MKKKQLKHGELAAFAKYINEPADKVRRWYRNGKFDDCIKGGKIQKKKLSQVIYERISQKKQKAQNVRWGKAGKEQPPPKEAPETEAEVESYLNESIGDLAKLSLLELQRRNELEKLLIQQIKRKKENAELIDAAGVERAAFSAGKHIKDQCTAIADRCASLVAAESDPFECKQILLKEINYILDGLHKLLLRCAQGD